MTRFKPKHFLFLMLFILTSVFFAVGLGNGPSTPDGYVNTTEGTTIYTDTTASTSTNDTSDFIWNFEKPIGHESEYDIGGEVKQNGHIVFFKFYYPGVISVRTRYLAADSSGYVQVYSIFGWVDVPLYVPGTTASGGDAKIAFTLKTGTAVWAFWMRKNDNIPVIKK